MGLRIGSGSNDWRITTDSLRKYLARRKEYAEALLTFGYNEAQMQAMRQAKQQREAPRPAVATANELRNPETGTAPNVPVRGGARWVSRRGI